MVNKQSELEYENKRLEQTVALARKQLEQAKERNQDNKSAIITAKQELRENTSHSIGSLWSGEAFEALAELSQYMNPITEKIADFEAVENKIRQLELMIESPYFARIDFKFEDEDEFEEIYIGRSSLMKDNGFDIFVYDWRSPIASVFYRFVKGEAYYDAPGGRITGEVGLKRQYEIKKGILHYFFDADVQIIDEFLRKLLSQNASTKMKTIVETIQREQDVVIRDMETGLMMVQGVAGSGKTSIALHRVAYLMYQGLSSRLAANDILIVSPNTLFEQYISNVLPELGESNVVSVVFEGMLAGVLGRRRIQSRNRFLEDLIADSGYQEIMKAAMEFKMSPAFMEVMNRFIDDLPHRWIGFTDVYYEGMKIIGKEALKQKSLSGKEELPLGVRLKLVEDYVIKLIREAARKGIKNEEEYRIREEMRKFTRLNLLELYQRLFQDEDAFFELARGITLPESIWDILIYTQENLAGDCLSYDDSGALAYLTLKANGNKKYKNIKQVVIDEAQDYYLLHFEIFNLLFPKAKFTILGDINQTLEKGEDMSLYEQIKGIFNKNTSSLAILDKSFRCTREILQYSLQFLDRDTGIKSFNRSGDEPAVHVFPDTPSLNGEIMKEIQACLAKGYGSIGLICKTEGNARFLYESIRGQIDVRFIKNESETDLQGVSIMPVYMSKGLEFDAVLLCDGDSGNYHGEDDKKLLYITCTRALHRLSLFCQGEASPFLQASRRYGNEQ